MKNVKKIGIVSIAAMVFFSSISAYAMSEYNIKTTQKKISASLRQDLQNYMNGYVTYDEVETKLLEQSEILENSNANILDEEQIESISDIVMESITPELIKDISSKKTTVSPESISTLETTVSDKIKTLIANQPQPTITSEEREAMTNAILAITEADTLKAVNSKYSVSESNINALKDSTNSKIANLESMSSKYDDRFSKIQTDLNDVMEKVNNSNSTSETDTSEMKQKLTKVSSDLASLSVEYAAFSNNALTTAMIVDNVNDITSTGVLSAKQGTLLKNAVNNTDNTVTTLKNKIDTTNATLTSNMEQLTASIQSTDQKAQSAKDTLLTLSSDMDAKLDTADAAVLSARLYASDALAKATTAKENAEKTAADVVTTNGNVQTATNKVTEATTKANEAAASAETASTKAGEASASATSANEKMQGASTKAGEAATSAQTATEKASVATTKANEAAASATEAANAARAIVEEEMDGVMKGSISTENGVPTLTISMN